MAPRRILVTGGAGFIGSHTADALVARGDHVTILDNFNDYYDPKRKRANIAEVRRAVPTHAALEVVEGDLRDRELVSRLVGSGFDAIVHLAAMAGVRASVENPWLYYDVNLTGTLNLLEAARQSGKPNFVFAGTSSAYGATKIVPFVETDPSDHPLAPYPASKRAAELLAYSYHHLHGLDFTSLRFFTVYGPRGRPDMMAWSVLDSLRLGRQIPLYNGGQMHRDWTYVSDIVSGVVAAADRRFGFEIVNLGRGEPILLADFVASIESLAGKKASLVAAPMMDADVAFTFADISKAQRLLGYAPAVGVGDGVRRFFDWYVEHVWPV